MSEPTKSPERKSMDYAEGLGLNTVYEDARHARDVLDDKLETLSTLRDKKRELEARRADLEMDVVIDETAKHPSMSQAALKEHVKAAHHKHPELVSLRVEVRELTNDIEGIEYDIEILKTDIKIAVSRLHELGGYFQFMAVIKQAAEARKASRREEGNPW